MSSGVSRKGKIYDDNNEIICFSQ